MKFLIKHNGKTWSVNFHGEIFELLPDGTEKECENPSNERSMVVDFIALRMYELMTTFVQFRNVKKIEIEI